MTIALEDFYVRMPEWDLTDYTPLSEDPPGVAVPNARQDALVTATLAGAEAQTDRTVFPSEANADEAVMYLAAHMLARSPMGMNMRRQAATGDKDQQGDDEYWKTYRRIAHAATSGYRVT